MSASRLLLIALAALAPAAQAGKLDDALLDSAPKLIEPLWRGGVRTVGVLPFQLRRGDEDAGYNAAPLCTGLTTRLENVLTLIQDPRLKTPIRVVRISPAQRRGWSASKEAFDGLFAASAEGVWGGRAKADGFLTGTIVPSADRKSVEIVVSLLKADSREPKELARIRADVDRSLSRDLGFNVASRALVLRKAKAGEEVAETPTTPDDVAGMKFEIEYDGKKQPIRKSAGGGEPAYAVTAPEAGQKVVLHLQRVGEEAATLGVVLKVNGRSVFEEQDGDGLACRKWLYPVTKKAREKFAGFYTKDGEELTCREFEVVKGAAAVAQFGPRASWIDVEVFVSRPAGGPAGDGELLISTRGLSAKKAATLAEAREALAKANGLTLPELSAKTPTEYGVAFNPVTKSRTAVTLGAGKPSPTKEGVSTGKFPNPARVGGLSVRIESADATKEIDD